MADQVEELESNVLKSFKKLNTLIISRDSLDEEELDAFGEVALNGVRVDHFSASNLFSEYDRDMSQFKTSTGKRGQLEVLVKDRGFLQELFGTTSWVQCDIELKDGICRFFRTIDGTY